MNDNKEIKLPVSLIGISGKSQSGKNCVASIINWLVFERYNYSWQFNSFAAKLKQIVSILTGIPIEDLEKEEVKSSYLGEEWMQCFYMSSNETKILLNKPYPKEDNLYRYHSLTVRELLQKVGTDAMRDVIHPDVWVNALMKDYRDKVDFDKSLPPNKNWLITDVRFPNEAKAIKDRDGIVIRVNRYPKTIIIDGIERVFDKGSSECLKKYYKGHESETSLDNYIFDYVIENDSDIPSLIKKIKQMLIHFNLLDENTNKES